MEGVILMAETEKYFLVGEHNIIVAVSQEQAKAHYLEHYGEPCEVIEEVTEDYTVGANINYNVGGFDEIELYEVLEKNKALPYFVDLPMP